MEFDTLADDRDRLARVLLAGALALVSIVSFRKGRRLVGVLAGVGAVGIGYSASAESSTVKETVERLRERESLLTGEKNEMRCSACSEPILAGQVRRPNAENQIVHEHCL